MTGTNRKFCGHAFTLPTAVSAMLPLTSCKSYPGKAEKFENEDMHEELAVNGIPAECNLDSLNEQERLSLQLYISAPDKRMNALFKDRAKS